MNSNDSDQSNGRHLEGPGGGCPVAWRQEDSGHDGVHLGPNMDLCGVITAQRLLHPDSGHGVAVSASWEDVRELGRDGALQLATDLEGAAAALRVTAMQAD